MKRIDEAIEHSRKLDKIAHLDWRGDTRGVVDYICDVYVGRGNGDVDYVFYDDTLDIWGWTEEMTDGEMDFRIHLHVE